MGVLFLLCLVTTTFTKTSRNKWISEPSKEVTFAMNGINYTACSRDVYEEDQNTPFRLKKLPSHPFSPPKPLQRQNIRIVCQQVFNDKTIAATTTLRTKLNISDGTIKWIELIAYVQIWNSRSRPVNL